MARTNPRALARIRRKKHIRKSVRGKPGRPRLTVFRSTTHIYAQVVDDEAGVTLASASTLDKELTVEGHKGNIAAAKVVGAEVAKRAAAAGVKAVVFDRNGFLYHGRVKALADAAREGGLEF
jgi:large subunit ribosomal protein L18